MCQLALLFIYLELTILWVLFDCHTNMKLNQLEQHQLILIVDKLDTQTLVNPL